jgi:hypothetical protein
MKKLQNLTEPQKVALLVAPLSLTALVASVALLTYYIDFMSALFIVVALLFIGAISSGVVVAVVKDEERIIVQRSASRRQNALQDELRDMRDMNACETFSLVNLLTIALDPMHADYYEARADLRAFIPVMDSEELTRYAVARWNGEGYSDDDMNTLARYRETFGGYDMPETDNDTNYTHSASTAFAIGTLDRAYVVNGETRYPLS